LFSGNTGIYSAQTISVSKFDDEVYGAETSIKESAERRGYLHTKMSKYNFRTKS